MRSSDLDSSKDPAREAIEVLCDDEREARAEAERRQALEPDPETVEWIYLRNKQETWVARRVLRHGQPEGSDSALGEQSSDRSWGERDCETDPRPHRPFRMVVGSEVSVTPTPGSSDVPKHRWLKWVGLLEPPPDPDAWTPIATGLRVTNLDTGGSDDAARIVEILKRQGIVANQRPYVLPRQAKLVSGTGVDGDVGPDATDRIRIAVLIHSRDLERANGLTELSQELSRRQLESEPISDEELARESLQADDHAKRRTVGDT